MLFYSIKKNNESDIPTNYELIWYVEKNIKNILIWNETFNNISYNENNFKIIKKTIFKIISILEKESILTVKKINSKNKTIKLIFFKTDVEFTYNYTVNDKEYNFFYNKNKYYLYINHFSNILEILKINTYSGENIILNSDDVIKKNIKNFIKIDWDLFIELINLNIKTLNFNSVDECLDKYNEIVKNKSYKDNKTQFEKLYNIVQHINFYNKNKNYEKLYFSFSFDFRGRLYADDSCSYTNSKITRNCIYLGSIDYSNYKPNENSKTEKIISKYKHLIDNENENLKTLLIWTLISIGKLFKNNKKKISIEEFINLGLKNLNSENINLKLDDMYEYIKYTKIYNNLSKNLSTKLYTISKDATASGIQHLIRILGEKNNESFIYANMNSELYWYDTYQFIIDNFIYKNNINDEYKNIFKRKYLKKTIMIENYGATFNKCYKDFISSIDNIDNKLDINKIKEYFKLFFYDLRSTTDNNIFFNNTEMYNKDNLIIEMLDSIINLTYFNINKKQISIVINKIRNTLQINNYGNINNKKSKSSYKANITHSFDSEIVRRMILINDFQIFTIHDCFIIPITETSSFIDLLCLEMKKSSIINNNIIKFNIYSPFIIL